MAMVECPYEAIFAEEDVPTEYSARGGEVQSMPAGAPGFDAPYDGEDHHGEPVRLEYTRVLEEGQVVDLTPDIQPNYRYFTDGPGYSALDE